MGRYVLLVIAACTFGVFAVSGSEVVVCSDAGAGGLEQFPDVCRMPDDRLICVFNAGYGHVSPTNATYPLGGRISFCTSSDEGRTWSAAQVLLDTVLDDRDPSCTLLSSGRMLLSYFDFDGDYVSVGTKLLISDNGGASWDAPVLIATYASWELCN